VGYDYDAIVIGGGPAGSFAARELARAGWRVLIVDRRMPGEGKCCGHCLSARALPILRNAGLLARVKSIAGGELESILLRTPPESQIRIDLGALDEERGLLVPRDAFDDVLRSAAEAEGAEMMRCASATVWRGDSQGAVVEIRSQRDSDDITPRRLTTRLIIGADGLRSAVARSLGLPPAPVKRPGCATGFSFDCTLPQDPATNEHDALDSLFPRGAISMHVTSRGYFGVARSGARRLHVGALVRAREERSRPIGAGGSVREIIREFPRIAEVLEPALARPPLEHAHAIGPMPWRPRRTANRFAALVGDAAGYAEPFTGEGMTWALESALLLTHAAASTGSPAWNARTAAEYETAWRGAIAPRLRRCGAIGRILRSPAAMWALPSLLSIAPLLSRAMVRRITASPLELAS
jgi:flavin-dependent dehydrogenase